VKPRRRVYQSEEKNKMEGETIVSKLIRMPHVKTRANTMTFEVNDHVHLDVSYYPTHKTLKFRPYLHAGDVQHLNAKLSIVTYDLSAHAHLKTTPSLIANAIVDYHVSDEAQRIFFDLTYAAKEHRFNVERLKKLIEQDPDDVRLLKREYEKLTGKQYRRAVLPINKRQATLPYQAHIV
jgi:hypothetical protein